MKQYRVFKHSSGDHEAVKEGWSWPAFFFSFFWAIAKQQLMLGVGVLIAIVVLSYSVGESDSGRILERVVLAAIKIVFGFKGNSWRENDLVSRGYELAGTFAAARPEDAVKLYIKANTGKR